MRGKLALLTGFAAGYVLGAKAGQERYEEIRAQFNRLMGTEPAQQLQAEVRQAAQTAGAVIEEKATEGIEKVSELVGSTSGRSKTKATGVTSGGTTGAATNGGSGAAGDITLPST
jgi:hypothetical protein